jgi:hypothetical protein
MLAQRIVQEHYGETYLDKRIYFCQQRETTRLPYFHQDRGKQNGAAFEASRLKSRAHTSLFAPHTYIVVSRCKVGLEEIMYRLDHCDDETTKKVYLHVTKETKKEASHKFAQLMRNL